MRLPDPENRKSAERSAKEGVEKYATNTSFPRSQQHAEHTVEVTMMQQPVVSGWQQRLPSSLDLVQESSIYCQSSFACCGVL